MASPPLSPHLSSPAELKARLEAERLGRPLIVYRDDQGDQRLLPLESHSVVTIGRDGGCRLSLPWDWRVSGLHAELREIDGHWIVVDDGLSRNGTFVNGEPVTGRRRIRDGDLIEVGDTMLAFRDPARRKAATTVVGRGGLAAPELSPAQLKVLIALCRPFRDGDAFASPAPNQQIADELHLSVHAVKTHIRRLFQRFGIPDLAQNEKRAALVRAAFESRTISPGDLDRG
jgi:hypothetical protein